MLAIVRAFPERLRRIDSRLAQLDSLVKKYRQTKSAFRTVTVPEVRDRTVDTLLIVRTQLANVCRELANEYSWMADAADALKAAPEIGETFEGKAQFMRQLAEYDDFNRDSMHAPSTIRGTDFPIAAGRALPRLINHTSKRLGQLRHVVQVLNAGPMMTTAEVPQRWTTNDAARAWNVSTTCVTKLCKKGRIPGAKQDLETKVWTMPAHSQRPQRTRRPISREKLRVTSQRTKYNWYCDVCNARHPHTTADRPERCTDCSEPGRMLKGRGRPTI